jgi:thiamine biosynthesis lipoprotein
MGTIVEITVASRSKSLADEAIKAGFDEIARIEDLLSYRKDDSVLARLNRDGASMKVPVGNEVFSLMSTAVEAARASGGAFDPTIGPLSRLWDFDHGGRLPVDADVERDLGKVGYKFLEFDKGSLSVGFAIPGMAIDLGGIGKRYAMDRVADILKSRGVTSAIIDAGGDIRVIGTRPGKNGWRIGVQHPRAAGKLLATLEVADAAVVTSGDYERFFVKDGIRYHHIIDPATGRPARGCQSVTVVASSAMEANSLAAFVLGPGRGLEYLRARPGLRGLIVDASGALHRTDEGFARSATP